MCVRACVQAVCVCVLVFVCVCVVCVLHCLAWSVTHARHLQPHIIHTGMQTNTKHHTDTHHTQTHHAHATYTHLLLQLVANVPMYITKMKSAKQKMLLAERNKRATTMYVQHILLLNTHTCTTHAHASYMHTTRNNIRLTLQSEKGEGYCYFN